MLLETLSSLHLYIFPRASKSFIGRRLNTDALYVGLGFNQPVFGHQMLRSSDSSVIPSFNHQIFNHQIFQPSDFTIIRLENHQIIFFTFFNHQIIFFNNQMLQSSDFSNIRCFNHQNFHRLDAAICRY